MYAPAPAGWSACNIYRGAILLVPSSVPLEVLATLGSYLNRLMARRAHSVAAFERALDEVKWRGSS